MQKFAKLAPPRSQSERGKELQAAVDTMVDLGFSEQEAQAALALELRETKERLLLIGNEVRARSHASVEYLDRISRIPLGILRIIGDS